MATMVVDDSCLKQADSEPKSDDLVWGSAADWRCLFTKWTEWTLAMTSAMMTTLLISSWLLLLFLLLFLLWLVLS